MSLLAVNGSFYYISSGVIRPPIMWPLHFTGKFIGGSGGGATGGSFNTSNSASTPGWGTPFIVNSGDEHASFFLGFRLQANMPGTADGEYTVAAMSGDGGTTYPMTLNLYRTSGQYGMRVKSGSTTICDTGVGVISISPDKYYVEWVCTNGGTQQIWLNEVQRATGSGGPGGTWNAANFSAPATGTGSFLLDDIYLTNGAGSAPLNGILGDVIVAILGPSADATPNAWTQLTVSTDPHWKSLNVSNADAPYLTDGTETDREVFDSQTSPPDSSTSFFAQVPTEAYVSGKLVYAVITEVRAKATALPRKLKYGLRLSSTDDLATQQLTTSFKDYWHVHPIAPDGAAWTTTKLDAIQLVLEVGANTP